MGIREKIYEDYSFLKPFVCDGREHSEVTKRSMERIMNQYDWYALNGYKLSEKRRQRSMSGCCLSRGAKDMSLDVSADILTAKSAFKPLEGTSEYEFFEEIYHSCGNIMPICEGGNIGGRPYKNGASPDYYARKLIIIRDAFTCTDNLYDFAKIIGTDPCEIGRNRKALIKYWIKWEWSKKDLELEEEWANFIRENYLEDLVVEYLDFESLHCRGENAEALRKVIRLIVRRGYRIEHKIHGDFSDDQEKQIKKILEEIFSSF